jgi:Replication-relaxation
VIKKDVQIGRGRRKVGSPACSDVAATERGPMAQTPGRSGISWLEPDSWYIGSSYAEAAAERLSNRDWAIIRTLQRVHLISGPQLERLHFHELSQGGRYATRARAMKRLVDLQVVAPFGNVSHPGVRGASPRCYVLDSVGLLLVRMQAGEESHQPHFRVTGSLDPSFVAHALVLSELFVNLVERARSGSFTLEDFRTGAAARWPSGLGGSLEPDAFVRLSRDDVTCYSWVELCDQAVSAPDLRSKLLSYIDLAEHEGLGPDGVLPHVLIAVRADDDAEYAQFVVDCLPEQTREIFSVALISHAAKVLAKGVRR